MKKRVAWGLAIVLAVLLLGGGWIGLLHTYDAVFFSVNNWMFLYDGNFGGAHGARFGPIGVMWWRRSDWLPRETGMNHGRIKSHHDHQ